MHRYINCHKNVTLGLFQVKGTPSDLKGSLARITPSAIVAANSEVDYHSHTYYTGATALDYGLASWTA